MKTPLVLLIAVFIGFNFQASGAETIPPKQGQGLNQANTMGAGVAPIPQFREFRGTGYLFGTPYRGTGYLFGGKPL